jgi:hypothetical protein
LDPDKGVILLMRTWDEKAKVPNWKAGPGFDAYIPRIRKLLSSSSSAVLPAPTVAKASAPAATTTTTTTTTSGASPMALAIAGKA